MLIGDSHSAIITFVRRFIEIKSLDFAPAHIAGAFLLSSILIQYNNLGQAFLTLYRYSVTLLHLSSVGTVYGHHARISQC